MKRCTVCGQEFPATTEYFIPNKRNKSGLGGRCRPCELRVRNTQAAARHEQYLQRKAANGDTVAMKQCSICGEEFPATSEHFYGRKGARDGLRKDCKKCVEERNARWQAENPERVAEFQRRSSTTYRSRNREAVLRRTREYKANNPDKARNYRDANRAAFALYARTRKDRVAGLPHTLTKEQWQFALDYFGGCCAVCGRSLYGVLHTPAIDHWIPISDPRCPGSVAANAIPLCHGVGGCNNSKHDRDPEEWLIATLGNKRARAILAKIQAYFALITQ